jgi:outer membrane murein-binding lipoprotein Lpp
MKGSTVLLNVIAAATLVLSGCSKGDKTPQSLQVDGVAVDLPKLNATFENADPEVKRVVTEVGFNLRYTKYEQALMSLDKLANDPKVTEPQKKVVNDVIEQVKKLANAGAAAAPAQ